MDALEHLGKPIAYDHYHGVDGGEQLAVHAIERFRALRDDRFLKLQDLAK